jgi:hypothetical protein
VGLMLTSILAVLFVIYIQCVPILRACAWSRPGIVSRPVRAGVCASTFSVRLYFQCAPLLSVCASTFSVRLYFQCAPLLSVCASTFSASGFHASTVRASTYACQPNLLEAAVSGRLPDLASPAHPPHYPIRAILYWTSGSSASFQVHPVPPVPTKGVDRHRNGQRSVPC